MGKDKSLSSPARQTGAVASFLDAAAKLPTPPREVARGRLIFAMDATASREPSWDHACQIQGEMFQATAELGGLAVQLVYYRGFDECRASPWVENPRDLSARMSAVHCLGGHTQIERVLRHTLKTSARGPVNALVFVGDCLEEDVDRLCNLAGQLGLKGVPAFMFHEGDDRRAASAFRQIAKLSGGAYYRFDAASAAMLKTLLGAVAAFAAGGRAALDAYALHGGAPVRQLTRQMK